MPTSCSAHRCTNRAKSGSNIQFFRFPLNNSEKLHLWLKAIGRTGFVPNAGSRLCSDHFIKSDFYDHPGGIYKVTLKNDAIPSVFQHSVHSTVLPTSLFCSEPPKKRKKCIVNEDLPINLTVLCDPNDVEIFNDSCLSTPPKTRSPLIMTTSKHSFNKSTLPSPLETTYKYRRIIKLLLQKVRRQNETIKMLKDSLKNVRNQGNISHHIMGKKKAETIEYGATKKAKQKQENNGPRPVPKTSAERSRAYRARKKAAQQQNERDVIENLQQNPAVIHDINGPNLQQQYSTSVEQMDPDYTIQHNNNSSDEESNENQPNVIVVDAEVYRASSQASITHKNQPRSAHTTSAERTRAYRARKKAAQQQNQQDVIENLQQNSAVVNDINGQNLQQQCSTSVEQMDSNPPRPVLTPAERSRAYRARKKAAQQQNQQDVIENLQQNSAVVNDINGTNLQQQSSTSVEQMDPNQPRPVLKTPAERMRAYRARKKVAQQQNEQDVH